MEHDFEFGKNSTKGYWQQCTVCRQRRYVHLSRQFDTTDWPPCPGPPSGETPQ